MRGNWWTEEEALILKKAWRKKKLDEICDLLPKHSKTAIKRKATKLRFGRVKNFKSPATPILLDLWVTRENMGWDRYRVAEEAGYCRHTIEQWERGESMPSLLALYAWCNSLGYELSLKKKNQSFNAK